MTVSSSTDCVIVKYEGRIATVMLNRPHVLNALDEATLKELILKLKEVSESTAEVVVLCGNGRGFSAGGDIKSMLSDSDESKFLPIMDTISELVVTLYTMPKLVISAIHGPTAGLGLSLALAADYVIADTSSLIAMNFIGIALIPDGGGHFFLRNRLGESLAKQVIWEGKRMSAAEALEIGMIDEVIEHDFPQAVKQKAEEWLKKPIKAMIQTKRILCEENKAALQRVLEFEKQGQLQMRQTADHKEGIAAFLEKRPPVFQGE
jgi:enoyl-CoA hydratase/carnithine racemase